MKSLLSLHIKYSLDYNPSCNLYVDNWTEFKRSFEIPEYSIKAYECNMLILIEEYINVMDEREFLMNEAGIKQILTELSKTYVFEDIGFDVKNHANWGYRDNGDIVCLDLGYMHPIKNNERALSCPRCSGFLKPNANFTGYICSNSGCRQKYNYLDIRRHMNQDLENLEDRMLLSIRNCEVPDFDRLNEF